MRKVIVALVVAAAFVLASCTSTNPVSGSTGKVGKKVGESSYTVIFPGFGAPGAYGFAFGDGGVAEAAKAAGITSVGTVDVKTEWYFVFSKVTTVVTGD